MKNSQVSRYFCVVYCLCSFFYLFFLKALKCVCSRPCSVLSSRGPPHWGPVRSRSCPAVSEDKWFIRQLLIPSALSSHPSTLVSLPSFLNPPPPQCVYLTLHAKNHFEGFYQFGHRPRIAACGDSFLEIWLVEFEVFMDG